MKSFYFSLVFVLILKNIHGQTESVLCNRNQFEKYCTCQGDTTFTCSFDGVEVKMSYTDPRVILSQDIKADKALELPDDLFQFAPTVTIVFIRGLRLKTLNSYLMVDLFLGIYDTIISSLDMSIEETKCKLQNFQLLNSEVNSIPADLLNSCTELKNIDLSQNRLDSLPDGLLGTCNSLLTLSLQRNNISNVSPNLLRYCYKLEDINLASNLIQSLSGSQFSISKSRIRFLNFESNKIQNIDENTFANLEFLEELNLNLNQLKSVPNQLFGGCRRLSILQMQGNHLSTFPSTLLTSCSRLRVLQLNQNQLTLLDWTNLDCRSLTYIGLENNKLRSIPEKIFSNSAQLNTMALSGNQFISLPEELFADLPQLLNIIFARNNLTKIPRNNKSCVEIFDANTNKLTIYNLSNNPANYINVSFNNIRTLTTRKSNCDIYSLDASHNLITDLHDGWTLGLQHLKTLNLSHNSLTYITHKLLILLDNVQHLNLAFNNISRLEIDLFNHMTKLITLQLTHNPIYYPGELPPLLLQCGEPEHIKKILFYSSIGSQRSSYFNCSSNNDNSTPENCHCIQNLIPFDSVPATPQCPSKCTCNRYVSNEEIYVDCANASVSAIPSEMPNNATLVNLNNNLLPSLSYFSHSSWSSVMYLYMSHSLSNSSAIKGQPFVQLTMLSWLDLSNNGINEIELGAFKGLSQLRYLDLSRNELSNISFEVFSDLIQVHCLDLSFNYFDSIIWSSQFLPSLKILKLTDNKITQLNWLEFTPSLTHLYLDNNSIDLVSETILNSMKNLKVMSVSHNVIETVDNLKEFPHALISFNVSYNKIENSVNLKDVIFPLNMSEFDLSGNNIDRIKLDLNKMIAVYINIYLQHNVINTVTILDSKSNQTEIGVVKLFLQNNSLVCDCNNTQNLIAMSDDIGLDNDVFLYVDDQAKCKAPIFFKDKPLSSLVQSDLPCKEDEHCPDGCDCYSHSEGKLTLDCIQNGLLPTDKAPPDVEALYVSNISNLMALNDSSWKNLEQIYFVDVKPRSVSPRVLAPLENLHNLKRVEMDDACWCRPREYVSYNIQGTEGSCLKNWPNSHCIREENDTDWKMVECSSSFIPKPYYLSKPICYVYHPCSDLCECYLDVGYHLVSNCSHRNLSNIPKEASAANIVDMDGNSLTSLPELSDWNNLTILYARGNEITNLLGNQLPTSIQQIYLDDNRMHQPLGWLNNVMLDSNNLSVRISLAGNPWICDCTNPYYNDWSLDRASVILIRSNSTFCMNGKVNQSLLNSLHCPEKAVDLIWGISVGLGGLTLVSVLVALYFRHRRSIHVALLARQWCLCLLKEENIDNDEKEYDAFISYSSDDSWIVVEKLLPGLEKLSFKLCVHERDWLGGQFISEQIVQSVQKSRRTIVVLSDNFIQSSWASLEFKIALQQALEDRVNRIIVVVPNELPSKDHMDPDLRAFVTMNTYLLCSDSRFWDKLVYSMPHRTGGGPVRRLPKDFVKLMTTQNSSKTSEETPI